MLPMHQVSRLAELTSLSQTSADWLWHGSSALQRKADQIAAYIDIGSSATQTEAPKGLKAQLRAYQLEGVAWLQFLKTHEFGGILADDMGLGKTLQTLASILLDKEQGQLTRPVLIVAPTSLLANWFYEAQRFTPSLSLLAWSGVKRHRNQALIATSDVIITSYGTLQQDAHFWAETPLHLVVLDEAQMIKNARSRIARVVTGLNTKHRLCLTGTPLENHLGELWSLYNFLMPGFLGTQAQFQRLYQTPIEQELDENRRLALVQRLGPFMLRRLKTEVATELPQKTIINEYINLTQTQVDLYETIRLTMSEELRKAVSLSGAKRNRLAISNALLKLRQVCCHPQLLKLDHDAANLLAEHSSTPGGDKVTAVTKVSASGTYSESGKLNWLADKLPGMLEEGRRILIFSSFTSMLTLIGELLDKLAVEYVELTGKSRSRAQLVERFQQQEVAVFLISLKAGGSGLNLTSADVVIHVDPWWNPAAEQQASDRAHRIGQKRPVFVYKLICKDTVEERIQSLQQSKHDLAQSIYSQLGQKVTDMNGEDWLDLLTPIALKED